MTTLKDLTWENHKLAEQTTVMQLLLKNQISNSLYCDLVYTKYQIYKTLEDKIEFLTPCLYRATAALNDWQEMKYSLPNQIPSLDDYVEGLRKLPVQDLWAHVYVHYLAPLYGGQIIRKVIEHRFPTRIYQFHDPRAAIGEVRSHLDVSMADQANQAFLATMKYYTDLYEMHKHDQLHIPD